MEFILFTLFTTALIEIALEIAVISAIVYMRVRCFHGNNVSNKGSTFGVPSLFVTHAHLRLQVP